MDPDRAKKILYGSALSGLAGLGIVLIVIFATGGSSKAGNPAAIRATMVGAGCARCMSGARQGGEGGWGLPPLDLECGALGAAHREGHRSGHVHDLPSGQRAP